MNIIGKYMSTLSRVSNAVKETKTTRFTSGSMKIREYALSKLPRGHPQYHYCPPRRSRVSPYTENPRWRQVKWGVVVSLKHSLEYIDELDLVSRLLRISTKREILEVLLTNILEPREINPVLTHLETAMYTTGFIPDQDMFNALDCQLDVLSIAVDEDILRQTGIDACEVRYELLYWINDSDVIIGEFEI